MKSTTQQAYNDTYKKTLLFLEETLGKNTEKDLKKAINLLKKAKRIFFTASGSSIPAAMFANSYLQMRSRYVSTFVSTSQILDSQSLNQDDVIVFISQGWDRADATFITQKAIQTNTPIIGLTAHPEKEYAQKAAVQLLFEPAQEHLFCRPASVITSYALLMKLIYGLTESDFKGIKIQEAFKEGEKAGTQDTIVDADQYVVLATGLGLAGGYNISLALREGAGKVANMYEIETYGHGWYVPDQIFRQNNGKIHYILVTHAQDVHSQKAIQRLLPLFKQTKSSYSHWDSSFGAEYGNIAMLSRIAAWISGLNKLHDYDMNYPPGKEENRGYHDIINYFAVDDTT